MPKAKETSSSSSAPTLASLEKRVANVERQQRRDKLVLLAKQKKQLLNAEMKSYSDNFLLKGFKFAIKDAQGDEEKEERFREKVLRVFVDQGLLPAKKIFVCGNGPDKGRILRGAVRHVHPLSPKDNATIVVAFLESWLAASINQRLSGGKRLRDGIRIIPHVPPIIDALRNEALKSRSEMRADDPSRKIVMTKMLKAPWIKLLEVKGGKKVAIDFPVEDKRLVKPAVTLAMLELKGKDSFTPKPLLPASEQARIGDAIVKAKTSNDDDDDDDEIDDEDVDELMDFE